MASIQSAVGGLTASILGATLGASHLYQQSDRYKGAQLIKQGERKQKLYNEVYGDEEHGGIYDEGAQDIINAYAMDPSPSNLRKARKQAREQYELQTEYAEQARLEEEDKAEMEKKSAIKKKKDEVQRASDTIRATILGQDIAATSAGQTLSYQEALQIARENPDIMNQLRNRGGNK